MLNKRQIICAMFGVFLLGVLIYNEVTIDRSKLGIDQETIGKTMLGITVEKTDSTEFILRLFVIPISCIVGLFLCMYVYVRNISSDGS